MKKKILCVLIIIMCFSFLPKAQALKCYYKAIEGYYRSAGWEEATTLQECIDEDAHCSKTKGQYHDFVADFTVPKEFDAGTVVKMHVKFTGWESDSGGDKVIEWNDEASFSSGWFLGAGCGDCENWFTPKAGYRTTGLQYVQDPQSCPPYISFRTGVTSTNNRFMFYFAEKEEEARGYIEWMIVNNKPGGIYGQNFYFLAKKYKEEDVTIDDEDIKYVSCNDFTSKKGKNGNDGCTTNDYFSCLWVKKGDLEYCNYDDLTYTKCGDSWDIPDKLPSLTSFFVNLIKILTPIILVFVSIVSLIKVVASQKDDELKKVKSTIIRRIIAAVIVFFIVQATQFIIIKVADGSESGSIKSCLSCLLNNNCSKSRYYKTMIGNDYYCTFLNDKDNYYDCKTGKLIGKKSDIISDSNN